jgi:hypothetical protein
MSQDTFPFAEGEEAAPFVEETEGSRKAVFVAGGVAAALVLAAGGWLFLGGSGDDSANVAFVPHKTVRPAAVAPKTVTKPAKKLPVAYKERLGRDPFRALYLVPAAAPPAATTPTGTGTGTTPGVPVAGTGTGTGTTPGTTTGTTRYPLKLVSISTPKPGEVRFFTWLVDGKKTVVIPAQRFGKVNGELVVLAYETNPAGKVTGAIIQVGDDSPIDVLIGETVSVL